MVAYILKRVVTLFLVFVGLAILIFIIARIVPGDPARIALGPLASAQQVEEMRQEMGLNDPFFIQLWNYLSGLVQGDLGKSLLTSRPVIDDILGALPATFELVLFTVFLQIVLSIPLGVLAAVYRDSWVDNITRIISLIGVVTPGFVLAIILQLLASYQFSFFPVTGRIDPGLNFEADITHSQAEEILWIIPDNYVNNSGRTISKLLKNINLPNNKIIIFHDDLDLNPGEVRLKEGGGHGGHNGLKDIFEKTGTKDYLRIRIGIGHPGNKDLVSSWVLNKFHPTDRNYIDEAYDLFSMNFSTLCAQEFSKLQKQLHTR